MMMNAAFVPGRKMSLCWLISLTSQGFPVSIPEGFNADNSLQSSEENKAKRQVQWNSKERAQGEVKLSTPNRMKGSWLLPLLSAFLSHAVVLSLFVISALCQLCSLTNIWSCPSPINKKNLKIPQPRDIISASTYFRMPELKMKICRLLIAMSISSNY